MKLKNTILGAGITLAAGIALAFIPGFSKKTIPNKLPVQTLHAFSIGSLDGSATINFADYKGKKILLVNTASACGFTPQYAELQKLHAKYKDCLVVIGLPCNDFGAQEQGSATEIGSFCQKNYGVDFIITQKVNIKTDTHPIYQWLTDAKKNGVKSSSVLWNFQKYLIDENGNLIDWFASNTAPMSDKITQHLMCK
jgi:glutathione peroxidase